MRAYVFTDKSLERYAGQFVWLSIDTEDAKNTAFLKAHPISVWPRLGRASESLVFALLQSQNPQQCAERALALYPRVRGTGSAVNVASTGLSCATELDAKSWNRSELTSGLEKATRETLAAADKIKMSADDRSGLYESLVDARDQAKDAPSAHKLREEWAAFLEDEAAKAKTPDQ